MTVFLTPGGAPFFGGTYFPPEPRGGMPGFPAVLRAAHDAFRNSRADVERAAAEITRALRAVPLPEGEDLGPGVVSEAVSQLVKQSDPRHGGFGGAPKFPHPAAVELLLRHGFPGAEAAAVAALTTLDRMLRGGIFDQLGGGFHRYSVDAGWAVPHFEKMLYDNAQLAVVYLHAHQLAGDAAHRRAVESTLDYLVREMLLPGGGFASSQDADTEGVEGRYFVWTAEQVRQACAEVEAHPRAPARGGHGAGDSAEEAATRASRGRGGGRGARLPRLRGVAGGELRGGPQRALARRLAGGARRGARPSRVEAAARVEGLRRRLLAFRERRAAPGRDDKVVTSWNGLALRAFAEAGAALDRSDYVQIGRNCADFLLAELVVEGRLRRSWKDGAVGVGRLPGGRRLRRRRPAGGVRGDRRAALLRRRPRLRRGGPGPLSRPRWRLLRHRRRRGAAAAPSQRRGGQPAPGRAVDGRPALRPAGGTDRRAALARSSPGDRRAAGGGDRPCSSGLRQPRLRPRPAASPPPARWRSPAPAARRPPGRCSARSGAAATPTGRWPGGPRPPYPCSPDGHRSPASPPPTSVRGSSAGRRPPTSGRAGRSARRGGGSPGLTATRRAGSIGATSVRAAAGRLPGGVVSPHQV